MKVTAEVVQLEAHRAASSLRAFSLHVARHERTFPFAEGEAQGESNGGSGSLSAPGGGRWGFVELPRRREVPTKELEHASFCFVLRDSVALISATTPLGGDVGSFPRDHVPGVVIGNMLVWERKVVVAQSLHDHL
jgi:hypothetical protein